MGRETDEQREQRLKLGGAWLLAEMQQRDWTQTYLGDQLGVAQQNIGAYIKGRFEMDGELARDLARLLGYSEYDTYRGLRRQLPVEVASRRRLIRFAFDLMTDQDAEDLLARLLPLLRTRARRAKTAGGTGTTRGKQTRVTPSGENLRQASSDEESVV